jgi:hypothetical protein
MAPPIATPTPQRRGDGFTIMEGKLTSLFFDQFKSKSPTVEGLAHTTRRHLTTAFSGAVNSMISVGGSRGDSRTFGAAIMVGIGGFIGRIHY